VQAPENRFARIAPNATSARQYKNAVLADLGFILAMRVLQALLVRKLLPGGGRKHPTWLRYANRATAPDRRRPIAAKALCRTGCERIGERDEREAECIRGGATPL
jgi:hypothetical protein